MKKIILNLLLVSSLFAGTYDDSYQVLEKKELNAVEKLDPFMYGNFSEIVRFDTLHFSNVRSLDKDLNDTNTKLDKIIETIHTYIKDGKKLQVKVIGYGSEATDDHNELVVDSDTYANAIQNWFRHSMTTEETRENSKTYSLDIAQRLVDNNISKDILVVEHRAAEDMGYTSATDEGRDMSSRVMVTMYVSAVKAEVVIEEKIVEKKIVTTEIVEVEAAQKDSDSDGVYDSTDRCPGTPTGLTVDTDGCPSSMTLRLNFKTDSAEILSSSDEIVLKFANFMKENPAYTAVIQGHTDSIGKTDYNQVLSEARAKAVQTALEAQEIDASRLESLGRGELSPIETNETAEGRAQNRRIEVNLSQ